MPHDPRIPDPRIYEQADIRQLLERNPVRAEMPIAGAGKFAVQAAQDLLNPRALKNMDDMYARSKDVFQGLQKAGAFGGNRNIPLQALPKPPVVPPRPDLVPVGGEAAFNAAKALPEAEAPAMRALNSVFQRILLAGGR